MSKTRQLNDRIETYDHDIIGQCKCGEPVVKVIGTDVDLRKDKIRYYYPFRNDANEPYTIFRCHNCKEVIDETFLPSPLIIK